MTATTTVPMSHKEATTRFRARLKHHGIKASVAKYDSCGWMFIRVAGTTPEAEFSDDQQRQISLTAKNCGLTFARGAEIDIDRCANAKEFHFLFQP